MNNKLTSNDGEQALGHIFIKNRNWYKKHIRIQWLNKLIKFLLNALINLWANLQGIKFPKKYTWDAKLEWLSNRFEPETVLLFKKIIKPNMIVLDIGGHIGYYSRLFSKLIGPNGQVHVFEPIDANFSILKHNTKKYKNVQLHQMAIGNKNGHLEFYKTPKNTGCHSLIKPDVKSEKIQVTTMTVASFMKKNNITAVDAIKIDVEGAEPLVFSGAEEIIKKTDTIIIVMEIIYDDYIKRGQDPINYLRSLESLGLSLYQIMPNGDHQALNINEQKLQDMSKNEMFVNLLAIKE